MKKIYLNYDGKEREGYESHSRYGFLMDERESVGEICGENVLEKWTDLVDFIRLCYNALKPGGKATFTGPYYNSFQAWADPRNVRSLSQATLNFADKKWREQNNYPNIECDFEVKCDFAIDLTAAQRSEQAKEFWLTRYNNVVQSIQFTLTKKE